MIPRQKYLSIVELRHSPALKSKRRYAKLCWHYSHSHHYPPTVFQFLPLSLHGNRANLCNAFEAFDHKQFRPFETSTITILSCEQKSLQKFDAENCCWFADLEWWKQQREVPSPSCYIHSHQPMMIMITLAICKGCRHGMDEICRVDARPENGQFLWEILSIPVKLSKKETNRLISLSLYKNVFIKSSIYIYIFRGYM